MLITMFLSADFTCQLHRLPGWAMLIVMCLIIGSPMAEGASPSVPDDPASSPLCFMAYDEIYRRDAIELTPDSTVALQWPVAPIKGYVEVRASVRGNGDRFGASHQRWGLKWGDKEGRIYRVAVSWGNTNFGDFTDRRYLRTDLIENDSVVDSHYYYKDVDLYDGVNTLALEFESGRLNVSVGARRLAEAFSSPMSLTIPDSMEVWTDAPLAINVIDVRSWPDYAVLYPPVWAYDELYEHIAASTDTMEAFWSYFDRITDGPGTQLGGRYLLATVRNDDGGYDIVMVDGWRVNPGIWQCGTLKGRLIPSIFIDTYTLSWRNAEGRWIHGENDLSATVSNASLLTLRFPHVNSTLRFSRVPLSQLRHPGF